MPITRSQGKAPEAWVVDIRGGPSIDMPAAIRNELLRSPSTADSVESPPSLPLFKGGPPAPAIDMSSLPSHRRGIRNVGDSDRTVRNMEHAPHPAPPTISRRGNSNEESSREPIDTSAKSHRTQRSRRRIRNARKEIIKIKLELAMIALEEAEEEVSDDDCDENYNSKAEYNRSWLEGNVDPQQEGIEATSAAEGIGGIRQVYSAPPPLPEDTDEHTEHRLSAAPITTVEAATAAEGNGGIRQVHSAPPPLLEDIDKNTERRLSAAPIATVIEDHCEPQQEDVEAEIAAEGNGGFRQTYSAPPPLLEYTDKNTERRLSAAPISTVIEAKKESKTQVQLLKKNEHSEGSGTLRPFISEFTSAIAALASKPKQADTSIYYPLNLKNRYGKQMESLRRKYLPELQHRREPHDRGPYFLRSHRDRRRAATAKYFDSRSGGGGLTWRGWSNPDRRGAHSRWNSESSGEETRPPPK